MKLETDGYSSSSTPGIFGLNRKLRSQFTGPPKLFNGSPFLQSLTMAISSWTQCKMALRKIKSSCVFLGHENEFPVLCYHRSQSNRDVLGCERMRHVKDAHQQQLTCQYGSKSLNRWRSKLLLPIKWQILYIYIQTHMQNSHEISLTLAKVHILSSEFKRFNIMQK